eukprot:4917022-Heterocapsa_arctica.AAC.1
MVEVISRETGRTYSGAGGPLGGRCVRGDWDWQQVSFCAALALRMRIRIQLLMLMLMLMLKRILILAP